jgi:hypothetical protein
MNNKKYFNCLYVWYQENTFSFKYKVLRKNDTKLALQKIYEDDYYIKPRIVHSNPYIENSHIVFCDIYDYENTNLNVDNRNILVNHLQNNKITQNPIISFEYCLESIDTNLLNPNKLHEQMNNIVNICLKCGIMIDEYTFDNENIYITMAYAPILNFCDDLLLFKYIISREFDNLYCKSIHYNFTDNELLNNYSELLMNKYTNKLNNYVTTSINNHIKFTDIPLDKDIYSFVLDIINKIYD